MTDIDELRRLLADLHLPLRLSATEPIWRDAVDPRRLIPLVNALPDLLDRIAELEAERAEWVNIGEAASLQRILELEAALRPFAERGVRVPPGSTELWAFNFSGSQLRAAYEALQEAQQ